MRPLLAVMAALTLAACAPDPAQRNVGFDGQYDAYAAAREAELRGAASPGAVPPSGTGTITAGELAAAGIGGAAPSAAGSFGPAAPAEAAGQVVVQGGGAPVPTPSGSTGISDEQDFSAVSSRETIASDRQRLEAQREAYRVIEAEPVPQRPADTGPNIVAYALSTRNQPGEQVYSRSRFATEERSSRNCARYASEDQAQEAFLDAGGPQRDRMGLDPDGDGFACGWDPRPFRAARSG